MPRSATEATRFTSTTPHAAIPPKKFPNRTPNLPGETPLERVKRLRAAADRARDAQITGFDRLVVRGRAWADMAHKAVNIVLLGSTAIVGIVGIYALGDMILYNRQKKAEFQVIQKQRIESAIYTARDAVATGTATPQQEKFLQLEDEHAALIAEKARKRAEPGIWSKAKGLLFWGLKDEEGEAESRERVKTLGEALLGEVGSAGENESGVARTIEAKTWEVNEKAKAAFEMERQREKNGGPLDRLGTKYEDGPGVEASSTKGGWTSWVDTRR